ncbi:MAG TPA: methylated-DNA--[protein]-cysteine S-methyltransferase, partial [Xanthomonadales bacterium]|nr:methylated-DNA--[protein]-cysteine S-methyltransferase [Xanthomonadales bacterium]
NVDFYAHARDALAAGFRPCKRCKPLHNGSGDPEWLPRLMAAVDADPARRWHDWDVAGDDLGLGIDPSTVRRWFIANHGMTFHAYARLRRLGVALRQIQTGTPVSAAIVDSGYESESGFREAFTQVFGNPPSAVDRESCIWINRVATPLGAMVMGVSDQGLSLLEFAERRMLDTQLKRLRLELGRVFLPGEHPLMSRVQQELSDYFDGQLQEFTIPVQASGTAFQESVWQVLMEIPYGQMVSYADVAHRIGQPEAVRAVGRANGDNRMAIIIPCHRVVGSDGKLTGYGGGLWRKKYLLSLEQSQSFSLA